MLVGSLLVIVYDFELQNSVCSGFAHYIATLHMIYVYRNYDKEIIFHFSVYIHNLSVLTRAKLPFHLDMYLVC